MVCLSGKGSLTKFDNFPPTELTSNEKWKLVSIDFVTYKSILNTQEGIRNVLYFENNKNIQLPTV